jgi:DNA-binding winged helix-turn-helix (wHTH) protein
MRYLFSDYVLDTQRAELQHAGAPIKLRRKVLQVLTYLLTHHERVIPKQELLEQLWPEQFVGDEALKSCIKTLRQALGERGRTSRFVHTLHGQGYRFVAPVEVQEPPSAAPAPPARRAPRPAARHRGLPGAAHGDGGSGSPGTGSAAALHGGGRHARPGHAAPAAGRVRHHPV